jgi:methylenetetrahydrofolate reductase (NADPH)
MDFESNIGTFSLHVARYRNPMRAPVVSFELFPPRDGDGEARFWSCLERLAPLGPRFVSVTYGADGSTRERTHRIVSAIQRRSPLRVAPHLTCIGAARAEILALAEDYRRMGIRHLVALRGDPPGLADGAPYVPHPEGFAYAVDLVQGLRSTADFEISVAAYPEGHPQAPSAQFDLVNLKRKIEAGASRAITQFFYDIDAYLRFRDRCAAAGIAASIVPGILPITQFPQVLEFATRCGARIPERLVHRFDGLEHDPDTRRLISAAVAIEQVETLQREGVDEFHFYTLNRAELTYAICHAIGVRPRAAQAA